MKVLSLALVGMFGYVGAASAACPAGPDQANGGAWSSKTALSGGVVSIATPGLDGSACKMTAVLGTSAVAIATVTDNSPANEPRYRFQFLIDTTAIGAIGNLDAVQIFADNAASPFPATGGRKPMVTLTLSSAGGGNSRINITASCNNAATNYKCLGSTPNLVSGVNRIEVDLQAGAGSAGKLNYWLNAAAGTTEPPATGTIPNLDNAGWVGAKQAVLGLINPTPSYRTAQATHAIGFDTFDSRRQTYIGH